MTNSVVDGMSVAAARRPECRTAPIKDTPSLQSLWEANQLHGLQIYFGDTFHIVNTSTPSNKAHIQRIIW